MEFILNYSKRERQNPLLKNSVSNFLTGNTSSWDDNSLYEWKSQAPLLKRKAATQPEQSALCLDDPTDEVSQQVQAKLNCRQ